MLDGWRLTEEEENEIPTGVLRFFWEHDWWIPLRVEWSLFDEENKVVGQLDAFGYDCRVDPAVDPDNYYVLLDWKAVENLDGDAYDNLTDGKYWHPVVAHLEQTKRSDYTRQINTYRHLLSFITDVKYPVTRMALCGFPKSAVETYCRYDIPVEDITWIFPYYPWKWEDDVRNIVKTMDDLVTDFLLPDDPRGAGPTTIGKSYRDFDRSNPKHVHSRIYLFIFFTWVGLGWTSGSKNPGRQQAYPGLSLFATELP